MVLCRVISSLDSKQSKNPRRPFEREKLINDLTTIGIYGLRCKREVWSQQLVLAKLRKAARVLLTMDDTDPRRIFEGKLSALFVL